MDETGFAKRASRKTTFEKLLLVFAPEDHSLFDTAGLTSGGSLYRSAKEISTDRKRTFFPLNSFVVAVCKFFHRRSKKRNEKRKADLSEINQS